MYSISKSNNNDSNECQRRVCIQYIYRYKQNCIYTATAPHHFEIGNLYTQSSMSTKFNVTDSRIY